MIIYYQVKYTCCMCAPFIRNNKWHGSPINGCLVATPCYYSNSEQTSKCTSVVNSHLWSMTKKSVPVLIVKSMHTVMSIWASSPQKITVLVAFNENGLTILVRVCQSGVFMISWSHMCTCIAFFNQAGSNVTVRSFVSMASHYLSKCVLSCSTPFKCQPRCFEVA